LEEGHPQQKRMVKASQEGQGPPRAVEPIMGEMVMSDGWTENSSSESAMNLYRPNVLKVPLQI